MMEEERTRIHIYVNKSTKSLLKNLGFGSVTVGFKRVLSEFREAHQELTATAMDILEKEVPAAPWERGGN